ncbi:SMI1/KNR4 family protein [Agrobacterium burrii]|uniref:SMI1/KNR4 family protein n=1 Tax=Agrobacterium burrii TaxID=2815339 RepID=A0ABS3EQK0_9HYPH|nr:SMI1/KNR4 family protein [Agrobacterium burrii]MBO0134284.1 SMI1/KNR4 family protein [Agrobacterium burrii]
MSITLEAAIEKLQSTNDWECFDDKPWSEADIADYERKTNLTIPNQLRAILTRYGWNGFAEPHLHANFVAAWDNGTKSVHESQVLVSDKEHLETMYRMFCTDGDWPIQFTPQMVFFGTADGGHAYLLMDGKNPGNNAVYFWERATDPFGTGNNARGIAKVADTLYEFFYNLKPREEL